MQSDSKPQTPAAINRYLLLLGVALLAATGKARATSTVVAHYRMGELEFAGGTAVGGTAATLLPGTGAVNMPVSGTPSLQAGGPATALDGSTDFMRFDGVAQRYQASPNLLGGATDGWMIEAWVRPQPGGSGLGMIVSHGHGGSGQVLNYDAGANRYGWFVGGVGQFNGSVAASGVGTVWDHVALVRTGGTTRLYVNGSLAGSDASLGTTPYANGSAIGSQYGGGSNHGFTGDIDEVYFSTVTNFNAETDLHMTAPADPLITVPVSTQDAGTIIESTTTHFDVVIENRGASNTLVINSVTGLSGDTGKFTLQTPLPLTIAPGGNSALTFLYAPGATVGTHSATFTIGNNDASHPTPGISLSGTSIENPELVPPSILSFGAVTATGGVTSRELVVENSGTRENLGVSVSMVSGDTAYFTVATIPGPITPGGSDELVIHYNPLGNLGSHSAVLEIAHNDADVASPVRITVTGSSVSRYTEVAHYRLGENDAGLATTVDDTSGYDLANINGSPGASYNSGSGVAGSTQGIDHSLNDVYRYTGVPAPLVNRTQNWGMAAWIRPDPATGSGQIGAGYGGLYFGVGNGSRGGFSIFSVDGSHWGLNVGGIAAPSSPVTIQGGTWTHVAAVALDNQIRLYVNGLLAYTYSGLAHAPNDSGGNTARIELGGQVANSWRTAGGVDEARIFTFVSGEFDPATGLHVTPPADADDDGLADAWEDRYFGNNDGIVTWAELASTTGSGDADNDSFTDKAEHDAATDPRNANSFPLFVTAITKTGNIVTVTFKGVDGDTYRLMKGLTLEGGFPTECDAATLSGTGTGTLQDTSATESKAFYRVETAN